MMPRMSEAELQQCVADACSRLGLLHYHSHDSRRSEPGFPDSVIIGPGGILFRELKSRDGTLRPEQRRWGSRITQAGGDWSTWRPRDWEDGTILRQLQALRIPRMVDTH